MTPAPLSQQQLPMKRQDLFERAVDRFDSACRTVGDDYRLDPDDEADNAEWERARGRLVRMYRRKQRTAEKGRDRANRATAQIREALAIMDSGSDYEKLHIRGILEAGL